MKKKGGEALNEQEARDSAVEEALFRRAVGYETTDVMVETTGESEKRRETTSHVPGDLRAQMFWLQSRCPARWGEKPGGGEGQEEGGVRIVDDVP